MEKLKTDNNENIEKKNTEKSSAGESGKTVKDLDVTKKREPVKVATPPKAKAPEPSKSDRLDRMEDQLNLIEDGLLVLINSMQWANLSITPIGTHNPDLLIDGYTSLRDAVTELANDGEDKVGQ